MIKNYVMSKVVEILVSFKMHILFVKKVTHFAYKKWFKGMSNLTHSYKKVKQITIIKAKKDKVTTIVVAKFKNFLK